MQSNRRNHYRILHVQPEAPFEVIRASYRTLMGTLKMHPDLGGDHATAALINQAWEVLSDPAKRAAYDRSLRAAPRGSAAKAAPTGAQAASRAINPLHCPFCDTPKPASITKDTRCKGCSAPLASPPKQDASGKEIFGRRNTSRVIKDLPMTVYANAHAGPLPGKLQDLSISGASFLFSSSVQTGQVLRLFSQDFEALACVVSARRKGTVWTVGATFVSVMFARQKGTVLSAVA